MYMHSVYNLKSTDQLIHIYTGLEGLQMNERQSVIFPLRVCGFIVITLEKEVVSQLGLVHVKCPKVQLCKLNLDELLVLYTMKTNRKILAIKKFFAIVYCP